MTVVASGYARKANDLYETPAWVTEKLLDVLRLDACTVWEPAAGNHTVARVLRDRGHTVVTSDIQAYWHEHDFIADFTQCAPAPCDAIVTNPPYGKRNALAATFCRQALALCDGYVCMLLPAKFDWAKTRADLFRDSARWHCKIVLLDRIQWLGMEGGVGSTEDHAWYVWRPAATSQKPPIICYA